MADAGIKIRKERRTDKRCRAALDWTAEGGCPHKVVCAN
ncbi:hypothetical protein SBA1_1420002 [Candidatus Sulfotelmatobacter kueseliae]|uniref:Uncharacterized protein n=1 Tax=Candidatus Sulfotelmatobacter kueseliae TaxID=2042962 RepID=A0A2U3K7P3_9BACT|nr:hypothetical protein SBA1_1420002 [Candidatus Sulfotelmatobacter kueseliae]